MFKIIFVIIDYPFREECSSKSGTNGGTCASGFGVCCVFSGISYIVTFNPYNVLVLYFSAGCGSTYAENCTYFEVNRASDGDCNSRICKVSSDICQVGNSTKT